jgi:predicted dehydrogenase
MPRPSSEKRIIRFGVVGLGGMGQAYCQTIPRVPRARLTAVCDADPARAKEIGHLMKLPCFTSVRELAKSGTCDAALIATPHPLHAEAALDCLEGGLHVLCEKPLTERLSTARNLVTVARRRRLALAVMLQCRFEPAFQSARALVASGRLGRLRWVEMASPDYRTQAYYDSAAWRGTWRGEGGGVLLNQAPHLLDQLTQLAGLPREVAGRTLTDLHRIEVEDYADALLRFPAGAIGYLSCSTTDPSQGKHITLWTDKGVLRYRPGLPLPERLCVDGYAQALSRHVRACHEVWGKMAVHHERIRVRDQAWGQARVVADLVRHLLDGDPLECSGANALASIELANAVSLSSWEQRPVTLPLDVRAYDRLLAQRCHAAPSAKRNRPARRVTDPSVAR